MRLPDKPRRPGVADEQIDAAMERGEFQNLKGKGQPLRLQGDLSRRRDMHNKLVADNGFSAPWDDAGREIERLLGLARRELSRALEFRDAGRRSAKANPQRIEAQYQAALTEVERLLGDVNAQVLRHNLLLPRELPHLHRRRVALEELITGGGQNSHKDDQKK